MSYTIYPMTDEKDKDVFLSFWNKYHEESLNEEFNWIEDNPAGQVIGCLIKDDETKSCVGCFVLYPRRFSVNGVNVRAGVARDFFTRKEHRLLGPAVKLTKGLVSTVDQNKFDFITTFPSRNAEAVMKRAGLKSLGSFTKMVKIMKTSSQVQRRNFPKYLAGAVSPLLDVLLRLFSFETWYRFNGGFICEEIGSFDERFDRLWTEARARFQVLGERTSEFLEWKYLGTPNAEHKIFAIFNSDRTALKGYVIYCMDEMSIDVRDFVFPEDKKATRIFMTKFLRHVRRGSPDSVAIQFLENKETMGLFRSFGFLKARCDRAIYSYCNKHILEKFPLLNNPACWRMPNGEVHY